MFKQGSKITGKSDIILWIQSTLNIKIDQLQELGTGHIYCLILNHYHPKAIPDPLINTNPRNEHQYVQNLKLFQSAIARLNCKRRVDIEKISKMKYQDNWETASWLKKYLEGQPTQPTENHQSMLQLSRRCNTPIKFNLPKQNHMPLILNQPPGMVLSNSTPLGKSSITSTLLQNNYIAIIDRMKQVLTSDQQDSEKLRLLSMLLNVKQKGKDIRIDSEIKQLVE